MLKTMLIFFYIIFSKIVSCFLGFSASRAKEPPLFVTIFFTFFQIFGIYSHYSGFVSLKGQKTSVIV